MDPTAGILEAREEDEAKLEMLLLGEVKNF